LAHFWPEYRADLMDVADTRQQAKITYGRAFLLMQAMMVFLLKLGSRRQVRFELDSPEALDNLGRLSGCPQESVAHGDTLDHFLRHVPLGALPRLRRKMIHRLVRMKALDHARLFGHFLVAVDGTGHLYFRHRHCEHCLTKVVDGQTQYYHHVLEAKLVSPEGLAISIAHEFIENGDPNASKQDCELAAFARLAVRLKKDFPQLLLCLCMDGLYANGTAVGICQRNGWKYFITFQKGSLPSLRREYRALRRLCPDQRISHAPGHEQNQRLAWLNGLTHVDDRKNEHRLNVLQCLQRDGPKRTSFAWLTNFHVTAQNVEALANRGARCRWKTENEGFNIQKNGGFNLEHAYSIETRASKNFYALLQIAHMILQLIERGSLLGETCQHLFGSLRNLSRRLAESLRNRLIAEEALDPLAAASIQIRLDST
jgi:hypothetical protein